MRLVGITDQIIREVRKSNVVCYIPVGKITKKQSERVHF